MTTWFRRRHVGILPLALLVAVTGCDSNDGGGSGGSVQLSFGTNNIQPCIPITVDVDLQAANAVLAQQPDGSVDCALDASLVGDGCSGTFDLLNSGNTLRVSIDGCVTPAITSLFACGFTKADISTLASATSAECECVGEPLCFWNVYCDRTPGICVSEDGDPEACEDCSNGVDDDGNGFTDCDDQNCHNENCGWGGTTITCSSTTTTTTTTLTGATSTTLPPAMPPGSM